MSRLSRPLAILSSPVVLPQAWWVRRTTPRLPEAPGARAGVAGAAHPPALSLLVIGESTAVGVGVDDQSAGLAAQLARLLARDGRAVAWAAIGRSGPRVSGTLAETVPRLVGEPAVVVVALGVTDVMGLTSLRRWRAGIEAILGELRPHLRDGGRIVLSGLPPLRHFPSLPQPAREVAALHADALDACLADVAPRRGALHVPIHHLARPDHLAADGFHPSAVGYRAWAEAIAAALDSAPSGL